VRYQRLVTMRDPVAERADQCRTRNRKDPSVNDALCPYLSYCVPVRCDFLSGTDSLYPVGQRLSVPVTSRRTRKLFFSLAYAVRLAADLRQIETSVPEVCRCRLRRLSWLMARLETGALVEMVCAGVCAAEKPLPF
jgi:hypothetical protein